MDRLPSTVGVPASWRSQAWPTAMLLAGSSQSSAGIGELAQLGDMAGGVGHDLHQAEGPLGLRALGVEAALGADHGVDQAGVEPVAAGGSQRGTGTWQPSCRRPSASRAAGPGALGRRQLQGGGERGQACESSGRAVRPASRRISASASSRSPAWPGRSPAAPPGSAPAGRASPGAAPRPPVERDPVVEHAAAPEAVEFVAALGRDPQAAAATSCGRRARRLARAAQKAARASSSPPRSGVVGQRVKWSAAAANRRRAKPRGRRSSAA